MFWCLRQLVVVIWSIFWYKGSRILFRGEQFNFIEPNSKSTINILVENFIPQNLGGQGQRMAHGDNFVYLYAGYLTKRWVPQYVGPASLWGTRRICYCGTHLFVRYPAYMLGTGYTLSMWGTGSLPTEKDCTQFRRTEWQYSFLNISGRGPVVS